MIIRRKYSWIRDLPDVRDFLYAAPRTRDLPRFIDLRENCPEVYDQGSLGSCTANAGAAAFQFENAKQNQEDYVPSRLAIYWQSRDVKESDTGATLRETMKTLTKSGAGHEELWPYRAERFTVRPTTDYYVDAEKHQVVAYRSIQQDLSQLQGCLASGLPFVFGFMVYSSFQSDEVARTGVMPMPTKDEKDLGGHAVLAVGYDDKNGRFIVRNSWGSGWGDKGHFYMPYAYLTDINLSSDFWCVQIVE